METKNKASHAKKDNLDLNLSVTKMTVFILTLSLISFSAGTSLAKERGKSGPPPERIMEKLSYELVLSEEQKSEIEPIIEAEAEKHQELRKELNEKKEEIRDRMKTNHQETVSMLAAILNPEQLKKFNEMEENRTRKREERRFDKEDKKGRGKRGNW